MTSALRWAAMRAILMFHICEEQSHKTLSTDHNIWRERRADADSIRTEVPLLTARPNGLAATKWMCLWHYMSEAAWLSVCACGEREGRINGTTKPVARYDRATVSQKQSDVMIRRAGTRGLDFTKAITPCTQSEWVRVKWAGIRPRYAPPSRLSWPAANKLKVCKFWVMTTVTNSLSLSLWPEGWTVT